MHIRCQLPGKAGLEEEEMIETELQDGPMMHSLLSWNLQLDNCSKRTENVNPADVTTSHI